MKIDRALFHALALALAGCGASAPAPEMPANLSEEPPVAGGVTCAKLGADGACRRWEPGRPPEPICVVFLPSGACATSELRRVAPVDACIGHDAAGDCIETEVRYLEPTRECVAWHEAGACARVEARYPSTVMTCADWSDDAQECRSWEPTFPAPAEESGSPF